MHIESSHPALSDRLIDAGIALAQEMQDIVDEAVDSAGGDDPEPGSATTFALGLIEEWEAAYEEHTQAQETERRPLIRGFSGNNAMNNDRCNSLRLLFAALTDITTGLGNGLETAMEDCAYDQLQFAALTDIATRLGNSLKAAMEDGAYDQLDRDHKDVQAAEDALEDLEGWLAQRAEPRTGVDT